MVEIPEIRELSELAGYAFGRDGGAWSRKRAGKYRQMKPYVGKDDVRKVSVYVGGRTVNVSVARCVLLAFGPPYDEATGCVPFHLDRDRGNCSIDNLIWAPRGRSSNRRESPDSDRRETPQREAYSRYCKKGACHVRVGRVQHDRDRRTVRRQRVLNMERAHGSTVEGSRRACFGGRSHAFRRRSPRGEALRGRCSPNPRLPQGRPIHTWYR